MNGTTMADDIALRVPLSGVHLIEASAGTGKTFTLTAWLLRLLIEGGVPLPQLLAVTFTRAATAELRERVRRRLRVAERLLEGAAPENEEAQQTAAIIAHAQAHGVAADQLRLRLQAALLQLDEACIFTIHGFCGRALKEFGFLAGSLNEDGVIDQADTIWQQVAEDLWREASATDAASHANLRELWDTPDALAASLPRVCDPARQLLPQADASDLADWLHGLRRNATQRFADVLAERRQRTQDQLIEQMWRACHQTRFASAVRQRWPMMLVDEFQDTDPRQWDIFQRIHLAETEEPESASGLFLIGDPKQAIYRFRGGDLPTYLHARDFARRAGGEDTLDVNYRSRPAVLRAIETLFTASPLPFLDPGIEFHPVQASARNPDDGVRRAGAASPGLCVHWLPADPGGKSRRAKEDDTISAIATCVAEIAAWLNHGELEENGVRRRVRPNDIAVLVRLNKQITLVRDALARAGIAAASQSNDSVFRSEAANEVLALLEAFAHPADPARLRAALATRLLGGTVSQLERMEADEAQARAWQERIEHAAQTWQQRGPLPALLPFLTGAAAERLSERDGARLMTDALHLAELLQAEAGSRHGLHGLLRWFAAQCVETPAGDELALRLESDTQAVQIVTLHKSKGLEYPIVLLPFTAFDGGGGGNAGVRCVQAQEDGAAANYLFKSRGSGKQREIILGDARHDDRLARNDDAERAEDLRLLYVGLTRARHALHLVWGCTCDSNDTPLQWLLHGGEKAGRKTDTLQPADMRRRLDELAAASQGSITVKDITEPPMPPEPLRTHDTAEPIPAARVATRALPMAGGQYSFSGLRLRHAEVLPARGADDEFATREGDTDHAVLLRGPDFGNAVHDALEAADFAQWKVPAQIPPTQIDLLRQSLKRRGLPQGSSAVEQTGRLVSAALTAPLPGELRLCDLPASQRVAEMEFHFRLGVTRLPDLYALLAQHGYPRSHAQLRSGTIEGLMHGYIDLIYRDATGMYYVLDYKTNQLLDYSAQGCAEAVRAHDYDLQYLIYLVALQRWLRVRKGADYLPARDLGGAVYLFLRGRLNEVEGDRGLHRDRPPQALIDALDALFDGAAS